MDDATAHRKLVKHYNFPHDAHELTWSCYQSRALPSTPQRRDLITDAIRRASERLRYAVLAFVIMPSHVHLLVRHSEAEYDVSELLYAIKRPSSFHFKQMMPTTSRSEYETLIERERSGKMTFRFWEEGPGYDRNLNGDTINLSVRYIHLNPVRRGCAVKRRTGTGPVRGGTRERRFGPTAESNGARDSAGRPHWRTSRQCHPLY